MMKVIAMMKAIVMTKAVVTMKSVITIKTMRAVSMLLVLFLVGCQTELYTGVSQKEGNEMLSILLSEGVVAT